MRFQSSLLQKVADEDFSNPVGSFIEDVLQRKDVEELAQFVAEEDFEYDDVSDDQFNRMRELMDQHPTQFQFAEHDLPDYLCPSNWPVPFPMEVIKANWTLDMLVDEYFGICYSPGREGERFPPGAQKLFADLIKQKAGGAKRGMELAWKWCKGYDLDEMYSEYLEDLGNDIASSDVELAQVEAWLVKNNLGSI